MLWNKNHAPCDSGVCSLEFTPRHPPRLQSSEGRKGALGRPLGEDISQGCSLCVELGRGVGWEGRGGVGRSSGSGGDPPVPVGHAGSCGVTSRMGRSFSAVVHSAAAPPPPPLLLLLLLLRQAAAGCVEDKRRDGSCDENYRDCTCASGNAATDPWERQDWKQGDPCIPDYINPEAATSDSYGSLTCGNTSIPACPSLGAAADDSILANCAPAPQPDACPGEPGGWDLEDCTFPVWESGDDGSSSCNPDPELYWGLLVGLVMGLVILVGGLAHNTMRNKQQSNFAENGTAVDGRCIDKEVRKTTVNSEQYGDGHDANANRTVTTYFATYTYVLPQNDAETGGQYWQVTKQAEVSKEHYDEMTEGGVVKVLYLKDDALLSNPKRAILQVQTTYADSGVPMFAFVG